MSLSADVIAWEQRWTVIVERVQASPDAARERARLAERNVHRARAALAAGDPDQALVDAETAFVNIGEGRVSNDFAREVVELADRALREVRALLA